MTSLPALYAAHLARDRRRSAHTVRAYRATAERLVAFLQRHRGEAIDAAGLATVEPAELRAFLAFRRGEGLGNASAARELSGVRGFLKFVAGAAAVPRVRGPRVKAGVPRPVSPADAIALAEEVADDARAPWIAARDWAVLLLLYGAGLRIGEAMALPGAILPLGEVLAVTGKRARTRMVPLLPAVRDAIEGYARVMPWPVARDQPLFRGASAAGAGRADDAACAAAQLCDASAGPRRRPALAPGAAGACQPQLDPGLYRGRCGAPARRLSSRASAGVRRR